METSEWMLRQHQMISIRFEFKTGWLHEYLFAHMRLRNQGRAFCSLPCMRPTEPAAAPTVTGLSANIFGLVASLQLEKA